TGRLRSSSTGPRWTGVLSSSSGCQVTVLRAPRRRSGAALRPAISDHREHLVAFEDRDLTTVGIPLGALVAQEEVEDVLAQRLGEELGALGDVDRLEEGAGQWLDPQAATLALGQRPDVVLGLTGQLVLLLDALQARGQRHGEGEVGVAGSVHGAQLDAGRLALAGLVHRDPDHRGAVVVAPRDVGG